MVKVIAVLNAKPGITREEFLHKWNVEHPVLVRKLPGIRRYRQNPAIEHRKEWPFNGMAELWFDSVADVRAAYAGEEAERLFAHEEEFLERMQWFIADEVEIDLTASS
ncbi:EthD family reductase [Sinomonas sp. B1-1]|uniref:EthD family reductase n=1 Tax=Sinomonas sp. B1-1 TaxID=3141454 RepID=UPI003D2A6402